MKKIILLVMSIVLLFSCNTTSNNDLYREYTEEEIENLEQKIKLIDKMQNVTARDYYETYMQLSEAYYQNKNYHKSLETVKKGLRLNARDYRYQLLAAKNEFELENYRSAYYRLRSIIESAEKKTTVTEAEKLLKEIKNKDYEGNTIVIPNKRNKYIYVLEVGKVDEVYMKAIKNKIFETYKIDVKSIDDIINPTKSKIRDKRQDYYKSVIDNFIRENGYSTYQKIMDYIKENSETEIQNEDKEFVYFLYMQQKNGEKLWKQNMGRIENQYNATEIINQIEDRYSKLIHEDDCLGILAVTEKDIYARDYNFLFGNSNRDVAVMSYNRFSTDENNRTKEIKRTLMQTLASVGHILPIERCTTPKCARAYPDSLKEQDQKELILCNECRANIVELYNRM
jgi:predicted Zn-dependent protease/Tfp pilus assembly protein PilP